MANQVPNREEIDRCLDQLQEQYGSFDVEAETVTNDPAFFEQGRQLAKDGWLGEAGAWIEDADGRVLLIRHAGEPDQWGTPGGGHEPGESFPETARREIREETGVGCSLTGVYWCRRKTIVHEANPGRRLQMLTVVFEAELTDSEVEIEVGDEEILEARWFEEPPDQVVDFLEPKVSSWVGE